MQIKLSTDRRINAVSYFLIQSNQVTPMLWCKQFINCKNLCYWCVLFKLICLQRSRILIEINQPFRLSNINRITFGENFLCIIPSMK